MNTRNVNVKTATKAHSKRYGQRRWEIMFFGQSSNGSIPMFSRLTALSAADAKEKFLLLRNPITGYFMGEPREIIEI